MGGGGGVRMGGGFSRGGGSYGGGGYYRGGVRIGVGGGWKGYGSWGGSYGVRRSYGIGFGYGPSWYRYSGPRYPYLTRYYSPYTYYPYFYSSFGLSPYYYYDWYMAPSYSAYYPSTYVSNYTQPPPVTYVTPAPSYGGSTGRDQYGQRREPSGEPVTYLIAFADGRVESCAAYWVEGRTLHYVTRDHAMKEAPLETVDRRHSEKLNSDRQITFRLPN